MTNRIKEPESEIERLKKENELKTGWISLLSHNLKENLSSLLWLIESVENETMSKDDFFKLLPRVRQDTQKNLQTVTDTEKWLKTQMGGFEPQKSTLSAFDLFLQLQEEFKKKLADKKINFQFRGDKNISLQTDRFLILFIFKKILDNAVKYSHPGETIDFKASTEKDQLVLSITDFGIGMKPEQVESLFSFPSIISKGTQGEIGAGLGLKIVKNFLFLLTGKIEVNSDKNTGTKISVFLPKTKE